MNLLPQLFDWLSANPWLNLIFLVLAVVSIIATVASHVLSRRRKIPCFDKKSVRLVEEKAVKMPGIRILYGDERIESLTLTKLAIWNAGDDLVEPADLAPSDRLRLEVMPPAKILGVEIAYESTPANNFRFVPSETPDTMRYIEFDYFHRREGIVVDLFHTGSDADVRLRGTLKGLGHPRRLRANDDALTDRFFVRPIVRPVIRTLKKLPSPFGFSLFVVIAFGLMPFMVPLFVIDQVQKYLRPIPKEFSL